MRNYRWMGLFSGALVSGAALCMGCSSEISGGEDANQGALAVTPVDPGCGAGGKPEQPQPPPSEGCQVSEIGDGVACQGDINTLKQQVGDACSQAGFVIVSLQLDADGCSGGQFTKATYTCCEPPLPQGCQTGEIGDGVACGGDVSTLKQQTLDLCSQAGLVVTNFQIAADGCSGSQFIKATYTCCEPPLPPPPPQGCQTGEIGDGVTCGGDISTLKQQGLDLCSQAGLVITDLQLASDGCSGGQFTKATYTCCEP